MAPAGNCHIWTYRGGVHGVRIGAELVRKQVVAQRKSRALKPGFYISSLNSSETL
jgi:hypothetical protein